MKSTLRHYAAAAVAALGFCLPASATSYGTDYTDLWWASPAGSENGWGINLIQQYETIFATLFVYGADNSARWYVADNLRGSPNSFSGTLYQTTGPAFSAAWTASAVATPVGTMTINFSGPNNGTLTYVVNGASVSKSIVRQAIRPNNLAGNFIGAMTSTCNGSLYLAAGVMRVQHSGSTVLISLPFTADGGVPGTCNYSGSYAPSGRLGTVSGNYTCSAGSATISGTFTLTEVDVGKNGFNSVYSAADQVCSGYSGFFGGVRDVP